MTFDMSNPRHVEALRILSGQPDKGRSEFIINCILRTEEESSLESMIRQAISEELKGAHFTRREPLPKQEAAPTNSVSELPGALLSMLEEI